MVSLARFSIRRPKLALAAWLVVAVALTLIGLGVSARCRPRSRSCPAPSPRAPSSSPTRSSALRSSFRSCSRDRSAAQPCRARRWSPRSRRRAAHARAVGVGRRHRERGASPRAHGRDDRRVGRPLREGRRRYDEPQIERLVSRTHQAPARAYVTGQPSIDRALKQRVGLEPPTHRADRDRDPVRAAADRTARPGRGAARDRGRRDQHAAGFGEVALLGHLITLDPVGVALGTMTGLALGVGFALLIIDRFHREEHRRRAATRSREAAPPSSRRPAGRSSSAAPRVVLALAIVAVIGPTQLMVSLGAGMLTCARSPSAARSS